MELGLGKAEIRHLQETAVKAMVDPSKETRRVKIKQTHFA